MKSEDRRKSILDEDYLSPEQRYEMSGEFDESSYEDDLEEYPDSFDENGWPLFGKYDRYALYHPITQEPWHKSPRQPVKDETDQHYETWCSIAEEFDSITWKIALLRQKKPKPKEDEKPFNEKAIYTNESKRAIEGNWKYIKEEIVPELDEMIFRREATPEFAELWGKFRALTASLEVLIPAKTKGFQLGLVGRKNNKDAQLKWYLHWREKHEKSGKSIIKVNKEFIDLVYDIAILNKRACPKGFGKKWFKAILLKDGSKFFRVLSDVFKRELKSERAEKLLASKPQEEPKIPPLTTSEFKSL